MDALARLIERDGEEVVVLVRAATTTARASARRRARAAVRRAARGRGAGERGARRPAAARARPVGGGPRSGWSARSTGSCTARPRSRSSCRWSRRAQINVRRRGAGDRAGTRDRGARVATAHRARLDCVRQRSPRGRVRRGGPRRGPGASATPTSAPSTRPSGCCAAPRSCRWRSRGRASSSDTAPAAGRPVFNVLYWPMRAFERGLLAEVPARADSIVDFVPVDYVTDGMLALLDDEAALGSIQPRGGRAAR